MGRWCDSFLGENIIRHHIQLFARVSDLISTEPVHNGPHYRKIKASIEKEGLRDVLLVDPTGYTCRGNTRIQIAKELGIEYVPIDLGFYCGFFFQKINDFKTMMIRLSILEQETSEGFHNRCRPMSAPNPLSKISFKELPGMKDRYMINMTDQFEFLRVDDRVYDIEPEEVDQEEMKELMDITA